MQLSDTQSGQVLTFIQWLNLGRVLLLFSFLAGSIVLYGVWEVRATAVGILFASAWAAPAIAGGLILLVIGITFYTLWAKQVAAVDALHDNLEEQIRNLRAENERTSERYELKLAAVEAREKDTAQKYYDLSMQLTANGVISARRVND